MSTLLDFLHPINRIVKLVISLTQVDSAAPETPIPSTKMNTGSSTMFITAPLASPIIEKRELP